MSSASESRSQRAGDHAIVSQTDPSYSFEQTNRRGFSTLEQLASLAIELLRLKRAGRPHVEIAQDGILPEERVKYDQILQVKVP